MEQKASEKLWTKRAHRGGTGDNLFKRKSCKAKVTSKTAQKCGMLACSSLSHCSVAMIACSILLVKLFLTTEYLGTFFPVLLMVFRIKLSSRLHDWRMIYLVVKWTIFVCLFVCFWQLYLYFFTGCSAGVQSFSLIVLILLEVTQYILQWLKLDDKIKMEEELCCPVAANYELSKDTEEKKSLFKKLRNQSQNALHESEVFWFIVISLDTSSKSFLFVSGPFIVV